MEVDKIPWKTGISQSDPAEGMEKVGTGADQHDMLRMGKLVGYLVPWIEDGVLTQNSKRRG